MRVMLPQLCTGRRSAGLAGDIWHPKKSMLIANPYEP